MTDSYIIIEEDTAGEYVRTLDREVTAAGVATNVKMQGVVAYRAGILNIVPLFLQDLGDATITLPYSAKSDETAGSSTSQTRVLTRRLFPSDTNVADAYLEKTTQATDDNTTVINCARFFLAEELQEALQLLGTVFFRLSIGIKTNNASGTAYLQGVVVKLRKLTAADTYTDIASATITATPTNATTSFVYYSFVAFADVSMGAEDPVLDTDEKLLVEVTTKGKISNASYICTHRLRFDPGVSYGFVDFPTEEA